REHVVETMRVEQVSLRERGTRLAREIDQLDLELGTQQSRIHLARQGLVRAKGLESVGFLSLAAADRERDALLEQESRLESLRRARMALERERSSSNLEADLAQARAQAQLA